MKQSAGLLIYRIRNGIAEVFLIHPGGPYWEKKDSASWSIPKGEVGETEDPLHAACREFQEETGFEPHGPYHPLTPVRQSVHKTVQAWAAQGDYDADRITSNTFPLEWPPKSGQIQHYPEADRAKWFTIAEARLKILKGQIPFLDELEAFLNGL